MISLGGKQQSYALEIPVGVHAMEIEKAVVVISQKTGKQELEIAFRVLSEAAKGVGFRRWYDIGNEKVKSLLHGLCGAAKVVIRNGSLDEADLVGKKIIATVSHFELRTGRWDYRVGNFQEYRTYQPPGIPASNGAALPAQPRQSPQREVPF